MLDGANAGSDGSLYAFGPVGMCGDVGPVLLCYLDRGAKLVVVDPRETAIAQSEPGKVAAIDVKNMTVEVIASAFPVSMSPWRSAGVLRYIAAAEGASDEYFNPVVPEELAARPWRAWPLGVLFGRCQAHIHGRPSPEVLRTAGRAWIDWAGPDEEQLAARRSPYARAEGFGVADLIDPRRTRPALASWVAAASPATPAPMMRTERLLTAGRRAPARRPAARPG